MRNKNDLIVTALVPDRFQSYVNYYYRVLIDDPDTNWPIARVTTTITDNLIQMQGFARIINDEYRFYWSTSDPWPKGLAFRTSSFNALNSKVGLIVDNSTLIMRYGLESKVTSY